MTKVSLKNLLISTTIVFFSSIAIQAQESTQSSSSAKTERLSSSLEDLLIKGYLDFGFQKNFNNPPTDPIGANEPRYRSYDSNEGNLQLNYVELSLRKSTGTVQFRTDLAFGPQVTKTAGTFTTSSDNTDFIPQAYILWNPKELSNFTLTAGKMYTHMGLETPRAIDNWQYSRGLGYTYLLPTWHTGLIASYVVFPERVNFSAFIYNGNDRLKDNNRSKTFGAALAFNPRADLTFNLNWLSGSESGDSKVVSNLYEVNGLYKFSKFFHSGFDLLLKTSAEAKTAAIYLKYFFSDLYSMSFRFEHFDDSKDAVISAGTFQKIQSYTLTQGFDFQDGLIAKFEIRADKSDNNVFKSSDGGSLGTQTTALAALLYSF
jgi:hypothetical protein